MRQVASRPRRALRAHSLRCVLLPRSSLHYPRLGYAELSVSGGGHVGEPETWQQEQVSLAYLSAVATRAGATSAVWNVDKDGVDVTLQRNLIDVAFQMKCTFAPTVLSDGETYAFDLDVRTY